MDNPLFPDHKFWNILTCIGALDQGLVEEYRESSCKQWRQLGEILVREGSLTVKQVAGLLGMQADEPHMRIGDLAVREGLIDGDQLVEALKVQRESCPHPLELMAKDDRLEKGDLFLTLISYVRFLEGTLRRAEALSKRELEHATGV